MGDTKPLPRPAHSQTVAVLPDSKRADGRGLEEFRKVFLQTGVISQATGSAYAEFRHTKVMVGVYGPRQSERRMAVTDEGELKCDVKLATFATPSRGAFGQSAAEKQLSAVVAKALAASVRRDTFPRAVVDVYCTILQSGGSDLGVLISAAAVALAEAGVEMRDLVSACCVARVADNLLLDPDVREEAVQEGGLLLAMMSCVDEVAQLSAEGDWSAAGLREAIELGMGGCAQVDHAMREALVAAAHKRQP